jgi:aryl-alcohol dehydrogenase-like predicted oxidoreductase
MPFQAEQSAIALGSEGLKISPLGVGTWAWGDGLFWSYGKDYAEADLRAAFAASLAAGVNFFDTAEIYGFGESERLLGQFMAATPEPVVMATKYFPLPWRFSPEAVSEALTASLERLGRSRVELYQVHWPLDFFLGQRALMEVLAKEVKQGRIGAIGVSNYSARQMREAHGYLAAHGVPLAVNQVQYSLLHRTIESNGVMATAQELGIVILAYSPLAQGLLTGKYSLDNAPKPEGARKISPRFSTSGLGKIQPLVNALKAIAQAHDKTPAQVALNWLICQGNVVPIPGAKNARQAEQNAGALGWAMTPAEHAQLSHIAQF